jgi:hypothetical protein
MGAWSPVRKFTTGCLRLQTSQSLRPVLVQPTLDISSRVGQNHIYTVYIRYFWLGNHQIDGVYVRIYTVLANPRHKGKNCACLFCPRDHFFVKMVGSTENWLEVSQNACALSRRIRPLIILHYHAFTLCTLRRFCIGNLTSGTWTSPLLLRRSSNVSCSIPSANERSRNPAS